jgi:hypothetical protein
MGEMAGGSHKCYRLFSVPTSLPQQIGLPKGSTETLIQSHMSMTLTEVPAATCEWCGQANTARLPQCAGCGTQLVSEPPSQQQPATRKGKDRLKAVCLALIFGPLGLIYINAWGPIVILVIIRGYFFATHTAGIWSAIGVRVVSGAFAYGLFDRQLVAKDSDSEAAALLDRAARMESVDREKAIAAYREVVRLYPNTNASSEATRNIHTLARHAAQKI